MNLGIIFLIIFVMIIIGVVIMVLKTMKKINSESVGVAVKSSAMRTAHDFLPFASIENDVIDLGGYQYRMVIEVSSVNYLLKNVKEQEVLEVAFRNFLNSIGYPFSMFVQTREIDLNAVVGSLKRDISETCKQFPGLKEYGDIYYQYITSLKDRTGCTKQKRKFIIIPYDETIKMTELNDKSKKSYSYEQIYERALQVVDGLSTLGITGHILTSNEIIQLFYSLTHRNDDAIIDAIGKGIYMAEYTKGRNKSHTSDELEEAIQILQEAENKFNINVLTTNLTPGQIDALRIFASNISSAKSDLMKIQKNGGLKTMMSLEEQFDAADTPQKH